MTDDRVRIRIGLAGPRGVGKTSLITSVIWSGRKTLAGSDVSIDASSGKSRTRMDQAEDDLHGWVLAGGFKTGGLRPSTAIDELPFELTVRGGEDLGVRFDVMDYPGGWLAQEPKPEGWSVVSEHLEKSTVLLVPIDATYVMSALDPQEKQQLPRAMYLSTVARVVRFWATSRNAEDRRSEPALMILVPVKCESWFSDNGGPLNQANLLKAEVLRTAEPLIREAATHAPEVDLAVWYCPVDTLGCVDLLSAQWDRGADPWSLETQFGIRPGHQIRPKGSGELLHLIADHILNAKRHLAEDEATETGKRAKKDAARAERDRGFFGNIWYGFTGKRKKLQAQATKSDKAARAALARLDQLEEALQTLARRPAEGRLSSVDH